ASRRFEADSGLAGAGVGPVGINGTSSTRLTITKMLKRQSRWRILLAPKGSEIHAEMRAAVGP
ncbi:MAG: hypothetical protein ACE5K9_06185, partial [Candidatus Methylomirabilales bacterium]